MASKSSVPDATVVLQIVDLSHVGEARRSAATLAAQLLLDERRAGELAIVVTEIANNLVRHGGGGEMLLRPIAPHGDSGGGEGASLKSGSGIEILALDRGLGIANIQSAMRDGFSTTGTPGNGLGAVQRLAGSFYIASTIARGTAVAARIWPGETPRASRFDLGAVCIPVRGETVCGDAYAQVDHEKKTQAILVDGLGHGPQAAEASQLGVAVFREHAKRSPGEIMERLHAELRPTRGAAAAIAEIDVVAGKLRFCGVGNIAAATVTRAGVSRSVISHNGTVGVEARRIVEIEQPWIAGSMLILTSDGITTRWQLADYPGLLLKHPSLVAGVIYRDHLRGRDDATVLALRENQTPSTAPVGGRLDA